MTRRILIRIVLTLVVFSVAFVQIVRTVHPDRNADFPQGTLWVCLDCGHEFARSIRQLAAWHREHPGQSLPCPACGSTRTTRAARCPNCGRFVPRDKLRGAQPPVCPYCHKPWPVLAPHSP